MTGQRKIIHIDMDAFFAAVEQRDFPEYRGKPLIVGGSADKRGVVATCSYEARKFGIHSAMSSSRAYRLCPQAIVVPPRFDAYREASDIIRSVFHQYTDMVEPLSLDEAYLDVSDSELFEGSATLIAREIKQKILQQTELTASAGVSYNKFLAKVASDINKPDGITVIRPDQGEQFVAELAVGKFHGVGKATEARMKSLGINTGSDLKKLSLNECLQFFGKSGSYYYDISRGIDKREVMNSRERKSLGSETTFESDIDSIEQMINVLNALATEVAGSLAEKNLHGYTITLKVKFDNFEQVTRSKTMPSALTREHEMLPVLEMLLLKTQAGNRKVRLLGVTISGFTDADSESNNGAMRQLSLF
ncbi:MAG: DNA polymerase IV [Gammaproteobacteria bacterium]|nr:DNA polymerase IV [Gammaproteobacteria bacterium]